MDLSSLHLSPLPLLSPPLSLLSPPLFLLPPSSLLPLSQYQGSELVDSWKMFAESMKALLATLQGFSTFMQVRLCVQEHG